MLATSRKTIDWIFMEILPWSLDETELITFGGHPALNPDLRIFEGFFSILRDRSYFTIWLISG